MSTESRLLELKKEIETAKIEKAQAEGALKQNMTRLKDEFKCSTVKEAKTKLTKLEERKMTLTSKIEFEMKKLEESYSW